VANANANAVRVVAQAMGLPGGMDAANLKVAQQYVEAFANIAKVGNTLIIPSNIGDVASVGRLRDDGDGPHAHRERHGEMTHG
jgi:hypothetical protein